MAPIHLLAMYPGGVYYHYLSCVCTVEMIRYDCLVILFYRSKMISIKTCSNLSLLIYIFGLTVTIIILSIVWLLSQMKNISIAWRKAVALLSHDGTGIELTPVNLINWLTFPVFCFAIFDISTCIFCNMLLNPNGIIVWGYLYTKSSFVIGLIHLAEIKWTQL